jgi:hypothetical protein
MAAENILARIRRDDAARAKLEFGPCTKDSPAELEIVIDVELVGRVRFTCRRFFVQIGTSGRATERSGHGRRRD